MSPEIKKLILYNLFDLINIIKISKCNIFSIGIILIQLLLKVNQNDLDFDNQKFIKYFEN